LKRDKTRFLIFAGSGPDLEFMRLGAVHAVKSTRTKTRRNVGTKLIGMTVPKTLTNALDTLINSPRGREILASALLAAAGARAAALTNSSDVSDATKARQAAADAGKQFAKDLSDTAADVVAGIVTEAGRSLRFEQ
jgi:hypothetical protein